MHTISRDIRRVCDDEFTGTNDMPWATQTGKVYQLLYHLRDSLFGFNSSCGVEFK